MERINQNFCTNKDFEQICREFETKKGCYLPYTSFLLKPAFHLIFYAKIIQSKQQTKQQIFIILNVLFFPQN